MIKVKFSTAGDDHIPYFRITPGSKGLVDNCQFVIEHKDEPQEYDWWVVVEGLDAPQSAIVPKGNTIFVAMENHLMKNYERSFTNQFGHVVTCHETMRHPHKILTQQGHFCHLDWFRQAPGEDLEAFRKKFVTYDQYAAMKEIPKSKLISVVTSHKVNTEGQILRNKFINAMKEHFGDRLDAYSNRPGVFGPDTKVTPNKWDGLAPYKYYLAIENSSVPQYWTSDIGDAYIAGAYPIYYGHPSVNEYFSPGAMTTIDIADIPGSIATIEKIISENYFEKRQKEIWEARELVLHKYTIFHMLAGVINSLPQGGKPELVTINPEMRLRARIVRAVNKIPIVNKVFNKTYNFYKSLTK